MVSHGHSTEYSPSIIGKYEGWNFNNGNYLFTIDTKWIHVSKFYCPSHTHKHTFGRTRLDE